MTKRQASTCLGALLSLLWGLILGCAGFPEFGKQDTCPEDGILRTGEPIQIGSGWLSKGEEARWCEATRGAAFSKDGPYLELYDDGSVAIRGQYADDRPEGRWTFYYRDGTKESEGEFHEGVQTGTWESWHKNGAIAIRYQLVDGKKEGRATIWREDGSTALLEGYRDGKLDGPWESRDEQGRFLAEGYADSATGLSVETIYSPGGRRVQRVWRLDGLEHGITTLGRHPKPAMHGHLKTGHREAERSGR